MNAFSLGVAVRFLLLVGAAVVAIALINAVAGREPTVAAQAPDAQPAQAKNEDPEPAQIPLHRIVAYTAGVSYFEHQSELNGDGRLELRLSPDEINDFLRSLVVEDAGGGHIDLVTYTSSTPAARVLDSFAVNLANNPSLPELLEQVRGEEVVVRAPQPVTGEIVSVEKQEQPVNEDKVIPVHVLNLRVETGLKPIPLDTITSIEFTNPRLKKELASALETLASMHNTQEKLVQLRFSQIQYVATSYGGFLGFGDKLFAIPWKALRFTHAKDNPDHKLLVLDMPQAALENAPGFNQNEWLGTQESEYWVKVDQFYKVPAEKAADKPKDAAKQ